MMKIWPGNNYPLGATYDGAGTNFSVFSEAAERVELCLFDEDGEERRVALHIGAQRRDQGVEAIELDHRTDVVNEVELDRRAVGVDRCVEQVRLGAPRRDAVEGRVVADRNSRPKRSPSIHAHAA